jgi:hypothetical protein
MKLLTSLLFLTSLLMANKGITEDKDYGTFVGNTTSYLYSIIEVSQQEMQFIYQGRLKTLNGSVPVKVFLVPLNNTNQKIALHDLIGLSVDRIKENVERNDNIIVVKNRQMAKAKLSATIGGIGILCNKLYYNDDGLLKELKVVR